MKVGAIEASGRQIPIVPILVGALDSKNESVYGQALGPYVDDEHSFFIISSDFCHWGDRFSYQPCPTDGQQICQLIEQLDLEAMQLIEEQNVAGFDEYLHRTGNTICGRHPIAVYLHALQAASTLVVGKFVRYAQSERIKLDKQDSSVSYASAVFSKA